MSSSSNNTQNERIVNNHARVVHIGPPKTGTSSIQQAARIRRAELLEHGVNYIGGPRRRGVAAFMGRGFGWQTETGRAVTKVPQRYWRTLKASIDREKERVVWLSQEQIAHSSLEGARRWRQEFGPDLHIVMTFRPLSLMVPSIWQQTLKGVASREPYDRWLRRALRTGTEANLKLTRSYDQAGLVERWSSAVGIENVTVVVLDPADHAFLGSAFERLLGLPSGLLSSVETPQRATNRSMSTAEIELIRRLNIKARDFGLDWRDHDRLVVQGAIGRLLHERAPGEGEARLTLPLWAEQRLAEEEERFIESIRDSGVRVLGDLTNLRAPELGEHTATDHRDVDWVPIDVAVEALLGTLAASTGLDYEFNSDDQVTLNKVKADLRGVLPVLPRLGRDLVRRTLEHGIRPWLRVPGRG